MKVPQGEQTPAAPVEYVFKAQVPQVVAPALEYWPAAQVEHVVPPCEPL